MGKLYDCAQAIEQHIKLHGLDEFKTRGEIAMKSGFIISLIGPDDADDPVKIEALRTAARDLLGLAID